MCHRAGRTTTKLRSCSKIPSRETRPKKKIPRISYYFSQCLFLYGGYIPCAACATCGRRRRTFSPLSHSHTHTQASNVHKVVQECSNSWKLSWGEVGWVGRGGSLSLPLSLTHPLKPREHNVQVLHLHLNLPSQGGGGDKGGNESSFSLTWKQR